MSPSTSVQYFEPPSVPEHLTLGQWRKLRCARAQADAAERRARVTHWIGDKRRAVQRRAAATQLAEQFHVA